MHYYRIKSTGQWGAATSKREPDEWVARYAADIGATADDIEVIESDADPRTGDLAAAPAPPPSADETDGQAIKDFVTANPDPSTWTTAQLRLALEKLITIELRRRGLV